MIRETYYRVFKRYERVELKFVTYKEADKLLKESKGKHEEEVWVLAKEEDSNKVYGMVYLERRKRKR